MRQLEKLRIKIQEALNMGAFLREWNDDDEDEEVTLDDYLVGQDGDQKAYFFPGVSKDIQQLVSSEFQIDLPTTNRPCVAIQGAGQVVWSTPREKGTPIKLSADFKLSDALVNRLDRFYPTELGFNASKAVYLYKRTRLDGKTLMVWKVNKSYLGEQQTAIGVDDIDSLKERLGIGIQKYCRFFVGKSRIDERSPEEFFEVLRNADTVVVYQADITFLKPIHSLGDAKDLYYIVKYYGGDRDEITQNLIKLLTVLEVDQNVITQVKKIPETEKKFLTGAIESRNIKFYRINSADDLASLKTIAALYEGDRLPDESALPCVCMYSPSDYTYRPLCEYELNTVHLITFLEALSKGYFSIEDMRNSVEHTRGTLLRTAKRRGERLWMPLLQGSQRIVFDSTKSYAYLHLNGDNFIFTYIPASYVDSTAGYGFPENGCYYDYVDCSWEPSKSHIYQTLKKKGLRFLYEKMTEDGVQPPGNLKVAFNQYLGLVPKDNTLNIPKILKKAYEEGKLQRLDVPLYVPANRKEPVRFISNHGLEFNWADIASNMGKSSPDTTSKVNQYASKGYNVKVYLDANLPIWNNPNDQLHLSDWNCAIKATDSTGKLVALWRRTGAGQGLVWTSRKFN